MGSRYRGRVLIIEDEAMIALMLEEILQELGYDIVGIAGTAEDAVAQIEADARTIDAATLDINLAGTRSNEVAEMLAAHGIPFVIMTGYSPRDLLDFQGHSILHKPFVVEQLEKAFQSLEPRRTEHR
ncbi:MULTISPECIES: response regulator [Rhodomicrobium]|uniref:response regulator n=1 Tax=Rhodomicrobium TaxID=1068 RepID=UPI0014824B80|nr:MULTISPECIES: response regulator [Rhodomicrobium]